MQNTKFLLRFGMRVRVERKGEEDWVMAGGNQSLLWSRPPREQAHSE